MMSQLAPTLISSAMGGMMGGQPPAAQQAGPQYTGGASLGSALKATGSGILSGGLRAIPNLISSIGKSLFKGDTFKEGLGRAMAAVGGSTEDFMNKKEQAVAQAAMQQQNPTMTPAYQPPASFAQSRAMDAVEPTVPPLTRATPVPPPPPPPPTQDPNPAQAPAAPQGDPVQSTALQPYGLPLQLPPPGYTTEKPASGKQVIGSLTDAEISSGQVHVSAVRSNRYLYIIRRYPMSSLLNMLKNWAIRHLVPMDIIDDKLSKLRNVTFEVLSDTDFVGKDPAGNPIVRGSTGPTIEELKDEVPEIKDPVMTSGPEKYQRMIEAPHQTSVAEQAALHAQATTGAMPYGAAMDPTIGRLRTTPSQTIPGMINKADPVAAASSMFVAPQTRQSIVSKHTFKPEMAEAMRALPSDRLHDIQRIGSALFPSPDGKGEIAGARAVRLLQTDPHYRRMLMDMNRLTPVSGRRGEHRIATIGGKVFPLILG